MAARGERAAVDELISAIPALTGLPVSAEHRRLFTEYLDLLWAWNRTHDLTGLRTRAQIVKNLFQDSLLFHPLLAGPRPLLVADLGAGAGIPGVPLRIIDPGLRLTLVESRRKRASFLRALRRELGLWDMEIVHGRAEAVVTGDAALREGFDVVVTRAMARPEELFRLVFLYLRPGGQLLASGPPPGARRPAVPAGAGGEWREVAYPALGLRRTFLVATRPG